MQNIGFIGLGIMGKPMAKNLLAAGKSLVVYDIVPAAVEELVSAGAEKGTSPRDVAERSDIVITMLPNSPHVKEAVCGKNGILEGAKRGQIIVDMSSIAPLVSRELGTLLAEKGAEMLDAPSAAARKRPRRGPSPSWWAEARRPMTK
jgi:3-hydroxyisobutyrate dehydrogenase and related beta-hydroxyacid dehydrogenases